MMLQYMEWILPLTTLWLICRILQDRVLLDKNTRHQERLALLKEAAADEDHDESKRILRELGREFYLFSLQCFESILLPVLVPYTLASTMVFLVVVVTGKSHSCTTTEITNKALNLLVEWTTFVGSTMVVLAIVLSAYQQRVERQQQKKRRRSSSCETTAPPTTDFLTSLHESNRLWGLSGAMMGTAILVLVDYQHHHLWSLPQALTGLTVFWGLGYSVHSLLESEWALKAVMTAAAAATTTFATKSKNKMFAPPQHKKDYKDDDDDDNDDSTDCSSVYFVDDVSVRVVVAPSHRSDTATRR